MDSGLGAYQIGGGRWHLASSSMLNRGMHMAASAPYLGFETRRQIPRSDAVLLLAVFGEPGRAAIKALPPAETFVYSAKHSVVELSAGERPVFVSHARLKYPRWDVFFANLKRLLHIA